MTTQKGFPYTKMFSSLSGVRVVLRILPNLSILCTSSETLDGRRRRTASTWKRYV